MPDKAVTVKKLGRYDITRVLGKGAMGVVYEARDPNLNRMVAIKTVRVDSLSKEEAAEYELRFRTEAHSAARLQHPNIVSVYDSDRDGETAFLVMEFVKGEDLKHYLDGGQRYSLEQSVRMMRDLLAALEYAHQRKIIHRDIKPANLLIEADGRVKLTDFGVARIQDSGEATRTQGGMVGTLKYMSPEQVEGKTVDSASDLFSAGIVLYQLLTDRRPFDGDSYFSIVNQITNQQPPAPSSINQMLPVALDAVVARALAKNKLDRFATAQDFMFALQAAARRADPTITPMANPYKIIEHHNTGSLERSGSTASMLGNTSSTVTQELELVYWKDVKESADTVDLEGFLRRFPEGVYADLAKRRLKRMADAKAEQGQDIYDRTMVAGPIDTPMGAAVAAAPADDLVEGVTQTLGAEPAVTAPVQSAQNAQGAQAATVAAQSDTSDYTMVNKKPAPSDNSDYTLVGKLSKPQTDPSGETPAAPSNEQNHNPVTEEDKDLASTSVTPGSAHASQSANTIAQAKNTKSSKLWLLAAAVVIALGGWWVWNSQNSHTNQPMITESSAEAGLVANGASAATRSTVTSVVLANVTVTAALANTLGNVVTPLGGTSSEPSAGSGPLGGASVPVMAASSPRPAASSPKLTASAMRAAVAARLKAAREAASHAPDNHSSTPRSPETPNSTAAANSTAGAAASSAQSARPKEGTVNPSAAGPKEACEGRGLFGYGSCLYEQCERPVFKNHPYCVDQRERTDRARVNR
jgi:eukaryotic-like serine/threonine-protein kinase